MCIPDSVSSITDYGAQTMVPPFADVASEKHRIAGRSTTDILSAAVEFIKGP